MIIEVNGKKIDVKEYGCSMPGLAPGLIPHSVNIFAKVTSGCQARCPFCSNADTVPLRKAFDINKLSAFARELMENGVIVNKVNITGGEPSLVPDLVGRILEVFSTDDLLNVHLHLNTNGLSRESRHLMRHPRWNSISVSLHHYDRTRLSELYGFGVTEEAMTFDGVDMMKMNASCNLIRGYIDSVNEVHRMLDFAIDAGITRIGFVSLMKVNPWCADHYVDFKEIDIESIPHVYFTNRMDRGEDCCCSNYLYNRNLKVLEIYHRNYANYRYCESSLVYDGEFFRQGFQENNNVW